MKSSFFLKRTKSGWLRLASLAAVFVAGAILCGCTRTATQPTPPQPTGQATQTPTPTEVRLGEPPKMPVENKPQP